MKARKTPTRSRAKKPAKRSARRTSTVRARKKSRRVVAPVQQHDVTRRAGLQPALRGYAIHNRAVLVTAVIALSVLSGSVAWVAIHNQATTVSRQDPKATIEAVIDTPAAVKADRQIDVKTNAKTGPKADAKINGKTQAKTDAMIAAMIDSQVAAGRDNSNVALIVNSVRPPRSQQQTASKPSVPKREVVRRTNAQRRLAPNAARNGPKDTTADQSFASAPPGAAGLIMEARRYLGTNPTGRAHDWCGAFLDMVLKHTGHRGGGNLARAYASYGTRIAGPAVGAIAVFARRGGGHVGIVTGIDSNGNPIVISGNHNHSVAEATYPARRAIAYVMPGG